MMNANQKATLLFDLDACESIFKTLAHQLENNAGIADLHPLAVLAQLGVNATNRVFDAVELAGMA